MICLYIQSLLHSTVKCVKQKQMITWSRLYIFVDDVYGLDVTVIFVGGAGGVFVFSYTWGYCSGKVEINACPVCAFINGPIFVVA